MKAYVTIGVLVAFLITALVAFFCAPTHTAGGIWVWGITTAFLGSAVVLLVAFGWPKEVYGRLKECASAIGPVVGASALAWSWFFQVETKSSETLQASVVEEIRADLKYIKHELEQRKLPLSQPGTQENTSAAQKSR